MRVRRVVSFLVLVMLVGLVAGSGYSGWVLIERSRTVELPAPTGEFQVGRAGFEWTDSSRVDPFVPSGGARKLAVWVWYPAAADATGVRAEYAPGLWSGLHLQGPASLLQGPFDSLRDHALTEVPVAPGRFPIVVLQPGMGFSAPLYASLAEDLASHGYLVAGVTPTYSANLTVLDGQAIGSTIAANPQDLGDNTASAYAKGDRIIATWAADARFAAATLAKQGGLFAGRIDTAAKVSYVGHSFGGAAALEACHLDKRCAGAVDLDGTQFGKVVQAGVKAPILLLGSEDSCITATCGPDAKDNPDDRRRAQSLIDASTGPKWCSFIPGARHLNFTDYGVFYLALPLRKYLPLGSIDPRRALTIQNGYVVTFLDHFLRGAPAEGAPTCKTGSS
jgi:dienelactone hydrolase